jgi:hypothetical protein
MDPYYAYYLGAQLGAAASQPAQPAATANPQQFPVRRFGPMAGFQPQLPAVGNYQNVGPVAPVAGYGQQPHQQPPRMNRRQRRSRPYWMESELQRFQRENVELRNEVSALRQQLMQQNLGNAAIPSQQAQPPPQPELRQDPIDPLRRPEDDSSRGPIPTNSSQPTVGQTTNPSNAAL